jgi:hypothetical protein
MLRPPSSRVCNKYLNLTVSLVGTKMSK